MAQNFNTIEQLFSVVKEFMLSQISGFCRQTNTKSSVNLKFIDDLEFSGLDTAMLLYDVEQEFNISLSQRDTENISTVGDFINVIIEILKSTLPKN